jgi:hypothetical protein
MSMNSSPRHGEHGSNQNRPRFETWHQRFAWIKRMPTRYKVLFGSQIIYLAFMWNYRLDVLEKSRLLEETEKEQETSNT